MTLQVTFHKQTFVCDSCDNRTDDGAIIWDDIYIVNPLSCKKCTDHRLEEIKQIKDNHGN